MSVVIHNIYNGTKNFLLCTSRLLPKGPTLPTRLGFKLSIFKEHSNTTLYRLVYKSSALLLKFSLCLMNFLLLNNNLFRPVEIHMQRRSEKKHFFTEIPILPAVYSVFPVSVYKFVLEVLNSILTLR